MVIASIELQKAIYSKLSEQYSVFDALPLDAPMPYIVIGEEQLLNNDTKTEGRTKHIVTIHTWSNKQSSAEIKTMNNYVVKSINENLMVNGFIVDIATLDMTTTIKMLEQNSYVYHGVSQISITLTERG